MKMKKDVLTNNEFAKWNMVLSSPYFSAAGDMRPARGRPLCTRRRYVDKHKLCTVGRLPFWLKSAHSLLHVGPLLTILAYRPAIEGVYSNTWADLSQL